MAIHFESLSKILKEINCDLNKLDGNLDKYNFIDKVSEIVKKQSLDEHKKWELTKYDINHIFVDSHGSINTLLHCAAQESYVDLVNYLLAKGANVTVIGNCGETPLHYACVKGDLDVVSALLKNGANINVANEYGYTPLHYAAGEGHRDVVTTLLENGADINAVCCQGCTPLHYASIKNHNDVKHILFKRISSEGGKIWETSN